MDLSEIEVVCALCSFPTVSEFDETGKVIGFTEEPGPSDEIEAMTLGWLDHGLGMYCPKCSLKLLEEMAQDEADGVRVGATSGVGEIFDEQFLKTMHPDVSEETIGIFVNILSRDRLAKLRAKFNLPIPEPIAPPMPRDEAQALEFIALSETIRKAL